MDNEQNWEDKYISVFKELFTVIYLVDFLKSGNDTHSGDETSNSTRCDQPEWFDMLQNVVRLPLEILQI